MHQGKTAGELTLKAASDTTIYDPLEVANAAIDPVSKELQECIWKHNKIFNEDEYFIGFIYAGDPLLAGIKRRNFYADLFLPEPRPDQTIFLYSKKEDCIKARLWVLPEVEQMIGLHQAKKVDPELQNMKDWSDAFFDGRFWHFIRKQHGISHLSKDEYSYAHRKELIKSSGKKGPPSRAKAFDFSKIATNKVIYPNAPIRK